MSFLFTPANQWKLILNGNVNGIDRMLIMYLQHKAAYSFGGRNSCTGNISGSLSVYAPSFMPLGALLSAVVYIWIEESKPILA
jgi:hypothetical protein